MTPEKQRITIAQSIGAMRWSYALPERVVHCDVPRYTESRDAMAEALAGLTEREKRTRWEMLYLNVNDSIFWDANTCPRSCFRCLESTPAQLAEAYLRTKGLWEE